MRTFCESVDGHFIKNLKFDKSQYIEKDLVSLECMPSISQFFKLDEELRKVWKSTKFFLRIFGAI